MKQINQFINEYIVKKKLDKFIDSEDHYDYFPKTKEELSKIIQNLLKDNQTNLNVIDVSKITDMSELFYKINQNIKMSNIDVSKWNVSKVKNMQYMFFDCHEFNCDLSNWNVSNVENMKGMFQNCENFEGKGLENWDVSNVKYTKYMFFECTNFNCDLSNWDVSNVESMFGMFYNCNILKNIPSWYEE